MLNRMRIVLALASLALAGHAQAQMRLTSSGGCETLSAQTSTSPCPDLGCDGGQVCAVYTNGAGQTSFCVAPATSFCCSETTPCPHVDGVGQGTCTAVSGVLGATGVCLGAEEDYCAEPPSVQGVLACRTTPEGTATSVWSQGDCDDDGLSNSVEMGLDPASTDYCVPATGLATFSADQCQSLPVGCDVRAGTGCPTGSSCVVTSDNTGTRCEPQAEDVLFCVPASNTTEVSCPSGSEPVRLTDSTASVCVSSRCADRTDVNPLACVQNADGALVPFSQGDCDGDGAANGAETEAGTNPCGSGIADGGAPPVDAEFVGGGGCACRSAPASSPSGSLFFLMIAASLIVLTRRR